MKSQFFKWFFIGLVGLSLTACGNNKSDDTANNTNSSNQQNVTATTNNNSAPTLSPENQKLAENCAKQNEEACKKLTENLVKECEANNAQSCVDSAVIFIQLNDAAVKAQNNDLAVQSYNLAVGSLIKACDLKNQGACNSLKELSNNIFKNLKTVKEQCENNKNADACKVINEAKQILDNSCKAGRQQDCDYLKAL
ncbi:hypothetical protein GKC56_01520 [Neisseriaceae bacterium PsAf]|nr:hypothetical protein [Neisseriaceae bacterium PsAf]MCV2502826.1 hypothetical protein [Neisseriaceae bacterium]